jgi:hypothetical protein
MENSFLKKIEEKLSNIIGPRIDREVSDLAEQLGRLFQSLPQDTQIELSGQHHDLHSVLNGLQNGYSGYRREELENEIIERMMSFMSGEAQRLDFKREGLSMAEIAENIAGDVVAEQKDVEIVDIVDETEADDLMSETLSIEESLLSEIGNIELPEMEIIDFEANDDISAFMLKDSESAAAAEQSFEALEESTAKVSLKLQEEERTEEILQSILTVEETESEIEIPISDEDPQLFHIDLDTNGDETEKKEEKEESTSIEESILNEPFQTWFNNQSN